MEREEEEEGGEIKGGDFYSEDSYKTLTPVQGEGKIALSVFHLQRHSVLQGKDRDKRDLKVKGEKESQFSLSLYAYKAVILRVFSLPLSHFLCFLSFCMCVCVCESLW